MRENITLNDFSIRLQQQNVKTVKGSKYLLNGLDVIKPMKVSSCALEMITSFSHI